MALFLQYHTRDFPHLIKIAANTSRKDHLLPRILATLALLVLSACAPAKIPTATPLRQQTLLPAPQTTTQPAAIPEESPPVMPIAEQTAATMLPVVEEGEKVLATAIEPATTPITIQPEYYKSFASYYAKRFNGRRTFTGERYDPNGLTAATRDFPLHSWLKVINPANGKEVNVRINDRTGKRKTPLIDLSRAAAKELDFLGKGKIRVHVIPLLPSL